MKAVQIAGPDDLRIIDVEKPSITKEDEVLVKMTAAGICGSDVAIYHGTNAAATYPRIIGHEMVGYIAEIGQGVKDLQVGDRVIIDQVASCGHCYPCSKGRPNVCDNLQVRGVHIDGGYREYICVPSTSCHILPDSISDLDAVMIEPTTIAINACSRAELMPEDSLLIMGAGALGTAILKIARLTCSNIIVADINNAKLAEAYSMGAAHVINVLEEDLENKVREYTNGRGTTVSIDAVCIKTSLLSLLKCTGNAGRVITMGFSVSPCDMNQFLVTSKELEIRGSRLQNRMFPKAISLIKEGKLDLTGSCSHTFKLTDAQKAFDFVDSHDPSIRKIVFTFDF